MKPKVGFMPCALADAAPADLVGVELGMAGAVGDDADGAELLHGQARAPPASR